MAGWPQKRDVQKQEQESGWRVDLKAGGCGLLFYCSGQLACVLVTGLGRESVVVLQSAQQYERE
jgi:hypothetical protein